VVSRLEANIGRDILSKIGIWHCPGLGELKFRGLVIKEGWDLHSQYKVMPLIATVLFLIVLGARLLYGDWSVAWNVGSFFVALVALSRMWAGYAVG
jgi:hypothetical protein